MKTRLVSPAVFRWLTVPSLWRSQHAHLWIFSVLTRGAKVPHVSRDEPVLCDVREHDQNQSGCVFTCYRGRLAEDEPPSFPLWRKTEVETKLFVFKQLSFMKPYPSPNVVKS